MPLHCPDIAYITEGYVKKAMLKGFAEQNLGTIDCPKFYLSFFLLKNQQSWNKKCAKKRKKNSWKQKKICAKKRKKKRIFFFLFFCNSHYFFFIFFVIKIYFFFFLSLLCITPVGGNQLPPKGAMHLKQSFKSIRGNAKSSRGPRRDLTWNKNQKNYL